jgi:predicted transporter
MLKMTELLWECLLISIVLLFGVNIGLAIGLTKIPNKNILSISLLYGAILFTLSILASYATPLYSATHDYISWIIGIIGVITILSGIHTVIKWRNDKEWRNEEGEYDSFPSKAAISSSLCCFVGFLFTAIMLSKTMESFYLEINIILAVVLFLIIFIFYSFSRFLRHAETPYPILLGNFMILNGFYFLIAALFLPTMETMTSIQTSPLFINSTSNLIFLIMAAGGIFLIGVYLKKEGITSLNDIYRRNRPN